MQAVFCSPSHCQGPVWGWEGGTTKQKPTSTLNFWYCCCFVLWLQTPWRNKMHQAVPKTHSLQTLGMIISASFSFQQQHMQQQLCSSALRPRVLWNPLENCDLHVKSRKIIFFFLIQNCAETSEAQRTKKAAYFTHLDPISPLRILILLFVLFIYIYEKNWLIKIFCYFN